MAAALRHNWIDIVEHGTAVHAKAAVRPSNGSVLPATFVFFIGDRFFGVVTAYVSGSDVDEFTFTSSLPTQVLTTLVPTLRPVFESDPVAFSARESPHRADGVERGRQ